MKKTPKFPVPVKNCDHGTEAKPKFVTISENAEGRSIMRCRKCGLEKNVTVRRLDSPVTARRNAKTITQDLLMV